MNKKNYLFIFLAAFLATFLRIYLVNNFIISIVGSFFFGFVIERKLGISCNQILLTGFCSCFTSFSGFIYFFYQLINDGNYVKVFLYLNLFFILNLCMMFLGTILSRKIT